MWGQCAAGPRSLNYATGAHSARYKTCLQGHCWPAWRWQPHSPRPGGASRSQSAVCLGSAAAGGSLSCQAQAHLAPRLPRCWPAAPLHPRCLKAVLLGPLQCCSQLQSLCSAWPALPPGVQCRCRSLLQVRRQGKWLSITVHLASGLSSRYVGWRMQRAGNAQSDCGGVSAMLSGMRFSAGCNICPTNPLESSRICGGHGRRAHCSMRQPPPPQRKAALVVTLRTATAPSALAM